MLPKVLDSNDHNDRRCGMSTGTAERFTRFADFYPFYLAEHSNPTCRRLHYIGSLLVLAILAYAVITEQWL